MGQYTTLLFPSLLLKYGCTGCLPFTPTLFTPTGIAYSFTFSKVHPILRTDVLIGPKLGVVIGINIHKQMSKVTPRTKIISREKIKVRVQEVEVKTVEVKK